MNKRKTIVLLTASLMIFALLFCGCGNSEKQKDPPTPERLSTEKSENSFGARYRFTLKEISSEIAGEFAENNADFDPGGWKMLSGGLVDDNGVGYRSYCNPVGSVTFTAAVEEESGKIMNIGCGCQTDLLEDGDFRESFLQILAMTAAHAGGYHNDKETLEYLADIFDELIDGDEDTLCYEGSLYIKSVDESTTVLMTAPCSQEVIDTKQYKTYTGN